MTFERAKVLLNRGLSRPSLFMVDIPAISTASNDYLKFFCKSTRIPEVSQETVGASGQGRTGIMRQQPTMITFGKPFAMTVIERSDFIVYKNMREWFEKTCPPYNTLGNESQRMEYYDNFVYDMRLIKLELPYEAWDSRGLQNSMDRGIVNADGYRQVLDVTFKNAYPTTIGDINFDTENRNSMTTFDISFNYESYHVQT